MESLEDLMSTLRRPLLASANDLQSRLSGMLSLRAASATSDPVPFLTAFMHRGAAYGCDDDPRVAMDAAYAINSTLFCFGEVGMGTHTLCAHTHASTLMTWRCAFLCARARSSWLCLR
jgi:hypothetical protein